MFQNIVNKDNIHKPQTKVEVSNFQNMASSEVHSTLSNPLRLHTNSNFQPELLIDEVTIEPSKKENENNFNVLTFLKENIKLPEEQEKLDNKDDKENENKNSIKLDSMSTIFVCSISIIGLFCVYKAIKKTM